MPGKPEENLATADQVAEYLGVSAQFLARQRMEPGGIPFSKIGRSVRYNWGDVREWIEQQKRDSTHSK